MRIRYLLIVPAFLATVLVLPQASSRAAEPDLAKALALLEFADHEKRLEGLDMLAELGAGAKGQKAAVKRLTDPDWAVQIRAAKVLGRIGDEDALDPLIKTAVAGEIQWVRDAAVDALKTLDRTRSADRLLDLARGSRDEHVKTRALLSGGDLATPEHLAKLKSLVKHKDPRVAAAAARAVGKLAADDTVREEVFKTLHGVLRKRGDKKHFFAYISAIYSLGEVDLPEVRTLLVNELIEQPDDDLYAPERIARSLALMVPEETAASLEEGFVRAKRPAAIKRLIRAAKRVRHENLHPRLIELMGHKDSRVRSEATQALGIHRAQSAKDPLLKALGADKSRLVRIEAVTALAAILDLAEFYALGERILGDKSEEVRVQFVTEVADLNAEAGIEVLAKYTADKHWRVASAAAATIGTLGVSEHLPLLEPLIETRDWKIRAAAYEGMGRLRAAGAIKHLAAGLRDRDPVVVGVCHANLQILTNEKFKADAPIWEEWWQKYGSGVVLEKRSRRTKAKKDADEKKDSRYARSERFTKAQGLEILQKARIIVVTGAWDKVQNVLVHLQIKHTLLRAQQLKEAGLNPNQIILVNCEGNMDKDTRERVQWFVNVGGYLMTTDWALTKTVMPCFPGYMTQYSGSSTGNDVVVVQEGIPGHPLTDGIFDDVAALKWWLEIQAFPITITYPERVEVIVDSKEMKQRYGSSPLGVVFRWGLGKVQHSASHFYLQEEGMEHARSQRDRMIFAADNLGLSLEQIRELDGMGAFKSKPNDEVMKMIASDYSMFRLIVNMVREKAEWVENL